MLNSADMFQTGQKPTDPNPPVDPNAPVEPQNPNEPVEPVSVRQPNQRVNEPQPPADPPANPEPPAEPEILTIEEMLVMEDEELKSYGIDDPKTWKSYQRLLHKKEVEWKKKEGDYEKRISNLEQRRSQPDPNQPDPNQQPRNTPLVKPQKPRKPVNYDYSEALTDPTSESAQYMNNMERYREEKDAYQDQMITNLTGYVGKEQQFKLQQERREQVKSQSLAQFQERGLTVEQATELYNQIEQAYTADPQTGADIFVNMYKGKQSNGSNPNPNPPVRVGNERRKLPDDMVLPPGINSSTTAPKKTQQSGFMESIAAGNQTKRIILNREKRR